MHDANGLLNEIKEGSIDRFEGLLKSSNEETLCIFRQMTVILLSAEHPDRYILARAVETLQRTVIYYKERPAFAPHNVLGQQAHTDGRSGPLHSIWHCGPGLQGMPIGERCHRNASKFTANDPNKALGIQ